MSFYNSDRARSIMKREGFSALIAQSPESVQYQAGYRGFFNRMLRNGSAAATVDFANPSLPPAMVLSSFEVGPARAEVGIEDIRTYETWIAIDRADEIESGRPVARPVQPTPAAFFEQLAAIFVDRGVTGGRVAVESGGMSAQAFQIMREKLGQLELVPADRLFSEVRAVKAPEEIEILRRAVRLTELGIDRAVGDGVLGVSQPELCLRYQHHVLAEALKTPLDGVTEANPINFNIGPDPFPVAGFPVRPGQAGDIVKLDAGVTVHGYRSDLGRTYSLVEPTRQQAKLARALLAGLEAGLAVLGPGKPLRRVFEVAVETVRGEGFPRYARGHVGHAIGLAYREDAPFISSHDETVAEAGMTFAVELPYYVDGLGAMLFEDNVVVTRDGFELLNEFPVGFPNLDR